MNSIAAQFWPNALPLHAFLEELFTCEVQGEAPYDHYIPLNRSRVKRIRKQLKLSEAMIQAAKQAQPGTKWLVINEHWCGDGAQILPVLEAVVEASEGRIEARACYRDADTDLIDGFLTNGGRSIPKLVQLNDQGEVTQTWGPRPQTAMALVRSVKSSPDPEVAANYAQPLHAWYTNDRQASIQEELIAVLAQA